MAALTSITGQRAPQSIVNAIFSVLDSNGDGQMIYKEILNARRWQGLESIRRRLISHDFRSSKRIYNGRYELKGELNGKPFFANINSAKLYYYNAGSGGAPSWSLDNRELDGTQDFCRGDGRGPLLMVAPPTGTRRWVEDERRSRFKPLILK